MEDVTKSGLEDFVTVFNDAKECLSKVKVYSVGEEDSAKVVDIAQVMKGFFDNLVDEETKNLVDKFSTTENLADKIDIIREYHQKRKEEKEKEEKEEKEEKGKEEACEEKNEKREIKVERRVSAINDLVQKERDLNSRIAALSPADRKEYYAKLYQIPTEKDLHTKLDVVLEKLEDLSSEVAIMRKHLYSK